MEEVHLTSIKPKNNVLLLAQEISFAKVLACNDKRLRDRGVRRLKKWFMARSQGSMEFTRDDFMRIWKGLFYCMWMSDKPLTQEDLAEEISKLIHSFATFKASLLFIETFYSSLSIEWFGIDQLRLDKYLMLVRRFMRQSLELVARSGWHDSEVQQLADVYHRTLSSAPMGLSMHIIEVFCEELAKVGKGELSSSTILQFIAVFAKVMASLKDGRMISQITRCVFLHLIRQTELGIEHHVKEQAWKEYGFPGGDVDAAEKIEIDSDEEDVEEGSEDEDEEWEEEERQVGVDARAGRVDVLLPPLDFDVKDLLEVLRELRNKKETTTKARKTLIQLITKYENLVVGKYPLGLHKVDLPNKVDKKKEIVQAAKRLLIEEEKLKNEEDSEVVVSLKKKNRKIIKTLKEKKSVWEVSKSHETSKNESEFNSSWEVSEARKEPTTKKKHLKKRRLTEEGNQSASDGAKKIKVSQLSDSESKDKSLSLGKTNTLKQKSKSLVNAEFSVSKSNSSSPEENLPKKKNKQNVTNKSPSIKVHANKEMQTPLSKNQKNSKLRKNQKPGRVTSEATAKEIQSPEIDSTTSNLEVTGKSKEESSSLQLNTSSTDKNNGWGGEWDGPSQDTEYEIFIPNKKYVAKRKSLGLPFPVSSFVQKSAEKITPVRKLKKSATPGSQKKVEFNLSANRAQEYKEYAKKLKSGQIAFDASKKPVQGLLKNSTPSPINPFYKKKLNFLKNPPSSC